MNSLKALKTNTQRLSPKDFSGCPLFKRAFHRIFGEDDITFTYEFRQNMNNLETQLNKENLPKIDSKNSLRMLTPPFQKFFHLELLNTSNYECDAREARKYFKDYTRMEAQIFKDLILQDMESIEKCINERALCEQEIEK
ncbi:hypothetical protein Tco_0847389 [Tanacetum coccineum]